jgi:3-dehydroquinate synthase
MTTQILFNASDRDKTALIKSLKPTFILVLTDTNTKKHCYPILERVVGKFDNVKQVTIRPGEKNKNFESVQKVLDELLANNAGKDALLINLGGGVVTDIGGFVASIYKRGIPYINIPTTLLAQADAAIGGKTGINAGTIKNSIGTIYQPVATIINTAYLDTLSEKEGLNGLAEMMKHALLDGTEHWQSFLKYLDGKVKLVELLKRSVQYKTSVVEKDPLENGYRRVLNFGHTVGHALESYMLTLDKPLKHGFAIAHGMKVAMVLSEMRFSLQPPGLTQARELVDTLFPAIDVADTDIPLILLPMQQDKKIVNNKLCFVLLEGLGKPMVDCWLEPMDVEKAMLTTLVTSKKAA